jgi:hypothetical protein
MAESNESLMAFATWLVEQPELLGSGYVYAVNNHQGVGTTLWWAGPATELQRRVLAEGRARGIDVAVRVARYTREALDQGAHAFFDSEALLAGAGFALASVSSMDGRHDGLRVTGSDREKPDEPLSEPLRAAVESILRGISGLSGIINVADVKIEHGARPRPL